MKNRKQRARKNLFHAMRKVTYIDSCGIAHTQQRCVYMPTAMHEKPYVWLQRAKYEVFACDTDIYATQYNYEVYAAVPARVRYV